MSMLLIACCAALKRLARFAFKVSESTPGFRQDDDFGLLSGAMDPPETGFRKVCSADP